MRLIFTMSAIAFKFAAINMILMGSDTTTTLASDNKNAKYIVGCEPFLF